MAFLSGIYIYLWLIHADIWQKPTQYCKAIVLQLKINTFSKRISTLKQNKQKNPGFMS